MLKKFTETELIWEWLWEYLSRSQAHLEYLFNMYFVGKMPPCRQKFDLRVLGSMFKKFLNLEVLWERFWKYLSRSEAHSEYFLFREFRLKNRASHLTNVDPRDFGVLRDHFLETEGFRSNPESSWTDLRHIQNIDPRDWGSCSWNVSNTEVL